MNSQNGQTNSQQPQPQPEKTPEEEVADRLADGAMLYLAPRMIAAEDFRASAAAYRNRVDDAHRIGLMMLGVPADQINPPLKNSDMGDLILQRDTIQNFPQAPARPAATEQAAPAEPRPAEEPKRSWLWPVAAGVLALSALGAGAGLTALLLDRPPGSQTVTVQPNPPVPPPTMPSDRDWRARVYVTEPEAQPTR